MLLSRIRYEPIIHLMNGDQVEHLVDGSYRVMNAVGVFQSSGKIITVFDIDRFKKLGEAALHEQLLEAIAANYNMSLHDIANSAGMELADLQAALLWSDPK